ncbi:MAG: hypothetical protein A2W91_19915 [Bacteroidetes bacterium GWF2_38_335]|nr:MAG: hypothetical protein A2W91_19915 [Bacteroidetes bacterium GWF2_38_335]OFY82012.1 MAG: hypothetical protein A2281_10005 [Bacteroidetes bacterium RIFOXYA12_FULL_38_20]HBS86486.1 hypothetical protein [Bacteroidales bacterium]
MWRIFYLILFVPGLLNGQPDTTGFKNQFVFHFAKIDEIKGGEKLNYAFFHGIEYNHNFNNNGIRTSFFLYTMHNRPENPFGDAFVTSGREKNRSFHVGYYRRFFSEYKLFMHAGLNIFYNFFSGHNEITGGIYGTNTLTYYHGFRYGIMPFVNFQLKMTKRFFISVESSCYLYYENRFLENVYENGYMVKANIEETRWGSNFFLMNSFSIGYSFN